MTGAALVATWFPPFSPQWGAWTAIALAGAAYAAIVRHPAQRASARQVLAFCAAAAVSAVALSWPLADLAAHRLLLALVAQRLLLVLGVAPLLLSSLPRSMVAAVTRPAPVDAVARAISRPATAVAVVTVMVTGSLLVPAVDAQATSALARGGLDLVLLVAGVVLWLPVRRVVPGTARLTPLGQAGYLVVQSIVPSFLCIVWIFARHPLYPAYAHTSAWGLTPLVDQQVSGFVAKLATICVLWTVAFSTVLRADPARAGADPDPLTWADVARELDRVERRERRGRPVALGPIPVAGAVGPPDVPAPVAPDEPGAAPGRRPGEPLGPGWALGTQPPRRRRRDRQHHRGPGPASGHGTG